VLKSFILLFVNDCFVPFYNNVDSEKRQPWFD
jgi:hypothetical protein